MLGIWKEILSRNDLVGGYIRAPETDGKPNLYHIKDITVEGEFIKFKFDWQITDDGTDKMRDDFEYGHITVMGDAARRVNADYQRIDFTWLGNDVTIFPRNCLQA